MPNPPPIERPKCYAEWCGRRLDGTCGRADCPVLPATPPATRIDQQEDIIREIIMTGKLPARFRKEGGAT